MESSPEVLDIWGEMGRDASCMKEELCLWIQGVKEDASKASMPGLEALGASTHSMFCPDTMVGKFCLSVDFRDMSGVA
jgi:hypothetical protein